MPDISATNMMIDHLVAVITDKLQTNATDLQVSTIRGGRLQDDPTTDSGLNILIHHDAESSKLSATDGYGQFDVPTYQIGGSTAYRTRLRIEVVFHFKEKNRDSARTKTGILLSRLKHTILHMRLPQNPDNGTLVDSYGESFIAKEFGGFNIKESGGPGQFIWYGSAWVDFITMTSSSFQG